MLRRIHAVAVGVGKIRDHAHFQQGQQQERGASLSRAISYCVYMLRSVSIIISVAWPSLVEEQDAAGIRKDVVLDETVVRHSSCTTAASASSRRKYSRAATASRARCPTAVGRIRAAAPDCSRMSSAWSSLFLM
jgi:hypothetical protein